MENSYEISSVDNFVKVIKNENDTKIVKSSSPSSSQLTGGQQKKQRKFETDHQNSTARKRQDVCVQPQILLEKLCIDANRSTASGAIKLRHISNVYCIPGMDNGEVKGKSDDSVPEQSENRGLKRKSPSSVLNKKKPYRSAARSEFILSEKAAALKQNDDNSSSINPVERPFEDISTDLTNDGKREEKEESEFVLPKTETGQVNNIVSDNDIDLHHSWSNLNLLKDNSSNCFTVKRDDFRSVLNNSSSNDKAEDFLEEAQNSGPRDNTIDNNSHNSNIVSELNLHVNHGDDTLEAKAEQNVKWNRSLKLKFSRIDDTQVFRKEYVRHETSSTGEEPAGTMAVNEKRGHKVARFLSPRNSSKAQRAQFARKFRRQSLKQRFVRIDSERFKSETKNSDGKLPSNEQNFDQKETKDTERRQLPNKFRLSPILDSSAPTNAASANVLRCKKEASENSDQSYNQSACSKIHSNDRHRESPKTMEEFREIVDKPRPPLSILIKTKPRDASSKGEYGYRSIIEKISDWDSTIGSKDDDKISSTMNSGAEIHSSFSNKRENIFDKFRSPMETEEVMSGAECLNLCKRKERKIPERQPPLIPRDREPNSNMTTGSQDQKDIKDLLGDYDSDSTECCKYEDLDQFCSDNSTANCGQVGGLVGRSENFYPGFSPFTLHSDSDDNLIVDESIDNQTFEMDAKEPTKKPDQETMEPDEDHQLKKLRSTAYRNYTRMQRRGNTHKPNERSATETVPNNSLPQNTDFQPPENESKGNELDLEQVNKKKKLNSSRSTTIKVIRRKKTALNKSTSSASTASRRTTLMDKKKSQGSQKAVRLCKEFVTRSKTRNRGLENGKSGRRKAPKDSKRDNIRPVASANDSNVANAAEGSESQQKQEENSSTIVDKIHKKRTRRKTGTPGDTTSLTKKAGRPAKCKTSASKEMSESEANQPPKIDILSRELGPRYNWLEQKIQAMQRSNSDEGSEMVRSQRTVSATAISDKRQSNVSCASDEEDRGSKMRLLNQSRKTEHNSSPSSRNHSHYGDRPTITNDARQSTVGDDHSSSHQDAPINFPFKTTISVGLRGSPSPTIPLTNASVDSAAIKARPSSAKSEPSTLEIFSPAKTCGLEFSSTRSAEPPQFANDSHEFETRSESSCPSLSQSVSLPYKRTSRSKRSGDSFLQEFADKPSDRKNAEPNFGRSLSMTNLSQELNHFQDFTLNPSGSQSIHEDEHYKAVSLGLSPECPAPFDLRLPTVCFPASKDTEHQTELSSSKSISEFSDMIPLQLTISPSSIRHSGDDSISKIVAYDKDNAEKQLTRIQNESATAASDRETIIIDLTTDAEPVSALPSNDDRIPPQQFQEAGKFPAQPDPNTAPVIRSIKHEYERRLEMYERLSKVSKIKDQEIAILESERRRVKNELECLKNIFLKATAGQSQVIDCRPDIVYNTEGVKSISEEPAGPRSLMDDVHDYRKAADAHSRVSTVSLFASQTPPEAHSAKTDLSMYTYLKCRYEQERSALDFSDPTGNVPKNFGLLKEMTETELAPEDHISPTHTISAMRDSFPPEKMPVVVQRESVKITNQCGSSDQTWTNLPTDGNWNGVDTGQPGTRLEIPSLISDGESVKREFSLQKPLPNDTEMRSEYSSILQWIDETSISQVAQNIVRHSDDVRKQLSNIAGPLLNQNYGDIRSASEQRATFEKDFNLKHNPPKPPSQLAENSDYYIPQSKSDPVPRNHPQVLPRPNLTDSNREMCNTIIQKTDYMLKSNSPKSFVSSRRIVPDMKMKEVDSIGHPTQYEAVDLSGRKSGSARSVDPERSTYHPSPRVLYPRDALGRMTNVSNETSVEGTLETDYLNREAPLALNLKPVPKSDSPYVNSQVRVETDSGAATISNHTDGYHTLDFSANRSRANTLASELCENLTNSSIETTIPTVQIDETKKVLSGDISVPSNYEKSSYGFRKKADKALLESGEIKSSSGTIPAVENQRTSFDKLIKLTPTEHRSVSNPVPLNVNSGSISSVEFGPHSHSIRQLIAEISPQELRIQEKTMDVAVTAAAPDLITAAGDKEDATGAAQQKWARMQKESPTSYSDRQGMSTNLQDMSFMVNSIANNKFPRNANRIFAQKTADVQPQAANEKEMRKAAQPETSTSASPNYNRSIPQRRSDRVEKRPHPYPAEPQMVPYRKSGDVGGEYSNPLIAQEVTALPVRRKDVEAEAVRLPVRGEKYLLEGPSGGAPSLQRFNELHQAMNHQARQPAQQFNPPHVASGLNPRESAFVPLPTTMRSDPASSRIVAEQMAQVSPNDLSRLGKPEAELFHRHVGVGALPTAAVQIPAPRQPEGQMHQRYFGNVLLHRADAHQEQQVNRKDGFQYPVYQKCVPQPVPQAHQDGGFHPDLSVPRLPYNREPEQPADFNRNVYAMMPQPRVAPEMQRDNVVLTARPSENLSLSVQSRNDAAIVNRILRKEIQAVRPPRTLDNVEFYTTNAAAVLTNNEHPGYVHVASANDPAGTLLWKVSQPDSSPVTLRGPIGDEGGHKRLVDFHARHPNQRPLIHQMVVDPQKGAPVPEIRDPMRLHQHGVPLVHQAGADRYLPTYIESILPVTQAMSYKTSNAMHPAAAQVYLQRQPTKDDLSKTSTVTPRHPEQVKIQMPPPPPTSIFNDGMRFLPHNHSFYTAQHGILPPGFIPGSVHSGPGASHSERMQLRPGFEQQCNVENYAPASYAIGDRTQLATNARVGPGMASTMATSQSIMATSLRQRQRHEEAQSHAANAKTNQTKVQSSPDAYKTQQQQTQMASSQIAKTADYICDVCRKPAMFVCSACKGVAYCSTECQAISWQKKHSAVCRQL